MLASGRKMEAAMRVIAVFILLSVAAPYAVAFKEREFKKCSDAAFCVRKRGKTGPEYSVSSVKVSGQAIRGKLTCTESGKGLSFTLQTYGDIARIQIDEVPANNRVEVRDVIVPAFSSTQRKWDFLKESKSYFDAAAGDLNVRITKHPFRLQLKTKDQAGITLNSRNMIDIEHKRSQKADDPEGWWEETFNGHTDRKPKGPQAISLDVFFDGFQNLYGIPGHASSHSLKATVGNNIVSEPYRMYNLDVFEYLDDSPFGLYGSIPLLVAHKIGLTMGFFWLNAAEMFVDVQPVAGGTAVQWLAESGCLDAYVLLGPSAPAVMRQYANLTGASALPQLFSLGYHQCRWNYVDDADARAVDAGFDQHVIPYDVLWLDIEHTDGKRYMTWDSARFPDPVKLQEDIASRGRKMVTIVDPHVKKDTAYPIYSEAQKRGFFVKNKDNIDFDGWCWPGSSAYLDVTNPEVRDWWASRFSLANYKGSTKHLYIWNDMNEPSVFNGPEITMPKDNIHYGKAEHRDIHNIYGFYYHLATADGLARRGHEVHGPDGDRPFVLSRAFFAGTQRVGPIWTGDNTAQWPHLRASVPMLLSLGIAGLPNAGADVGGFFGNPDAELTTRWYQLGTYYPFFRGHAHLESKRREPWLFGEPATRRIRDAIRERYALLPYIYTLFWHANKTNEPIMRPLWYEFPKLKEVFNVESQFMLGPGIMVCPVLEKGSDYVTAIIPKASRWYDSISGELLKRDEWLTARSTTIKLEVNMDGIPTFYKGGHIVPRRDRVRRCTEAMNFDPYTLVVALDKNGAAKGDLFVDDGHSYSYKRGRFLHRFFEFSDLKLRSYSLQAPPKLSAGLDIEKVVLLGLPNGPWSARVHIGSSTNSSTSSQQQTRTAFVVRGAVSRAGAGSGAAHTVRQAKLPLNADWTLELVPQKAK